MDPIASSLAAHPFWKDIDPALLPKLAKLAQLNRHGVGDLIFQERHEADHLYLLHRGHVALEAFLPGTGVTTLAILGPGEALGWSWLFEPFRWQYSARSVDATEVIAFSAARLRQMADEDPAFGRELVTRMAQVLLQRLQLTRHKLGEFHDTTKARNLDDVLGEADEEMEAAPERAQ
jgi:CRP-like cAMP-binding protein